MNLSSRSRYGIRALMDLAVNARESCVQLGDIAARNDISVKYLEQIVAPLSKAGLVESGRGSQGGYRLITGNEMGVLLLDYLCCRRSENGTMPARPVAVTTIVSTDMATPVAKKYGVELRRTLTGFKFIGEQIGKLEKQGKADSYVFGFEESYGYLTGSYVRDKDGVDGAYMICEMFSYYATKGISLLDKLDEDDDVLDVYHNWENMPE